MAKKKTPENKMVNKEEENKTLKQRKQTRRHKVEATTNTRLRRKEGLRSNMKQMDNKSKIRISGNENFGAKILPIVMSSENSGNSEEEKNKSEEIDGLKYHIIKLKSSSDEDCDSIDILEDEGKHKPEEDCVYEMGHKTTIRKVRSRI
jgi:hypothetical protein